MVGSQKTLSSPSFPTVYNQQIYPALFTLCNQQMTCPHTGRSSCMSHTIPLDISVPVSSTFGI